MINTLHSFTRNENYFQSHRGIAFLNPRILDFTIITYTGIVSSEIQVLILK